MRYAISYWAMRVCDLRIADLLMAQAVERGQVVELAAAHRRGHARRVGEVEHRVAVGTQLDALVARRQEAAAPVIVVEDLPARQLAVLRGHDDEGRQIAGSCCPGHSCSQAPMLGRPGCSAPVRNSVTAGAWLIASVCIERMKQMSSAMDAGVRQEIAQPWPALAPLAKRRDAGQDELPLVLRHGGEPLAHLHATAAAAGRASGRGSACSRTDRRASARRSASDR